MRPSIDLNWARLAAALGALALALACGGARADTPIALFSSFAGNVNFTGTQKTMRTKPNGAAGEACVVVSANTQISATLTGVPAGATILSAQLYWAASNITRTNTVSLDGTPVTAPVARQYSTATDVAGSDYTGAAADVTAHVAVKGNGTYTFSGLAIKNGNPYCAAEGVLGGFSLLVIYSHPSETYRVLNLYEGFQYIHSSGITLNLSNFSIPNPIGSATGRLGHITWEGDSTLVANGETLKFNNVEQTDALNPSQNQFNSASNVNNDAASYGIDFDAYTIASPTIQGGQTSATTNYQSGQDLVLLNAEIIAVPNVPVADLAIAMTVDDSAMTLGQSSTYRLTVSNNGPQAETGPIVVTDTLPPQFAPSSAGGSGWSCSISGQTVSCTWPGALAMGASLPQIAIAGTVVGLPAGSLSNSASVAGRLFDNIPANSTAAASASVSAPGSSYVFTDAVCNEDIAFGAAGQICHILTMKPLAAGAAVQGLYITFLSDGVPTLPGKKNKATSVPMQFALSCVNPATNALKQATFTSASATLPVCTANGAIPTSWTPLANVTFPKNSPSVAVNNSFSYPDVGRIELFMRDNDGDIGRSGAFVSYPPLLKLTSVSRNADGFALALTTPPAVAPNYAFLKAGELFSMTVGAYTADGTTVLPNFGKEGATISLTQAAGAGVVSNPALAGGFGAIVNGITSGAAFSWSEVGSLVLTPKLTTDDYLGTGTANIARPAVTVGRFYPDHFDTVAVAPMTCMTNMACPAKANSAAYSRQPFSVVITARNAAGGAVTNFSNNQVARDVTLGAYSAPAGTTQNPAGGALAAGTTLISASAFASGAASTSLPSYALPLSGAYLWSAPHALTWTPPTPIYLRATASETGTGGSITVTSARASPAITVEGGITVITGRLRLSNAHGSELLKLPVKMEAQYWTAAGALTNSAWEDNLSDSVSPVTPAGALFTNCVANACTAGTGRGVATVGPVVFAAGAGTFWLSPPGANHNGSFDIKMADPVWLPSTVARITYGIYRSPLIYLREVY